MLFLPIFSIDENYPRSCNDTVNGFISAVMNNEGFRNLFCNLWWSTKEFSHLSGIYDLNVQKRL